MVRNERGSKISDKLLIAFAGRMKHGELFRALQRRGWTQSQAAEFIGWEPAKFGRLINLQWVPKEFTRREEEKLVELTGKSLDDLFPPELRNKEFLEAEKTVAAFREVHVAALADIGILQLSPAPDEFSEQQEMHRLLDGSLEMLTPKEAEILRRRFGYYGQEESYEKIASDLGHSGVGIAGMEKRALRRLRHPFRSRKLRDFTTKGKG